MKTIAISMMLTLAAAWPATAEDIAAYDLNGDLVTFSELVQVAPGTARADFLAVDTKADSRLSAREFTGPQARALVSRQGAARSHRASGRFVLPPATFSEIDADGDGRITFEELYRVDVPAR